LKTKLFNIPKHSNHPIITEYDYSEKRYGKFHFHQEVQLTFIKKGEGLLLCGTSSIRYQKGDFIIIGSLLPHVFIGNDEQLTESISIYFKYDWLIKIYPESNYLIHFDKISNYGVRIENWKHPILFDNVMDKGGLYKIKSFFELFEKLSETNTNNNLINESSILDLVKNSDSEKINNVFKFISENIEKTIKLNDLASISNLTPPSFCRFFKQKTNKTVTQYISELRIESACKLLQNENLTVEDVGYKIGYNNFSNFLRQFKKIKHLTPKEFRYKNYKTIFFK